MGRKETYWTYFSSLSFDLVDADSDSIDAYRPSWTRFVISFLLAFWCGELIDYVYGDRGSTAGLVLPVAKEKPKTNGDFFHGVITIGNRIDIKYYN